MKLRTDFVTNSSSTSYIIELPKKHPLEGLKEKYKDDKVIQSLFNVVTEMVTAFNREQLYRHGDESGISAVVGTKAELDKHFVEEYGQDWAGRKRTLEEILEDKYTKEEYDRMLGPINDGQMVASVDISYHNNSANNVFKILKDNGFIKVLWSDH